jgi:uncharacterized Zn-binding protein involved in type VI secretion
MIPAVARQTDPVEGNCSHGCPLCPHPVNGLVVSGSNNVFINGLPAARQDDKGLHAPCCDGNTFTLSAGSGTVKVNGKPIARAGDATKHCGGSGSIKSGSNNVNAGG